jgi:hypothetical protein
MFLIQGIRLPENLTNFIQTVQKEKPADSWQGAAGSAH